MFTICTNQFNLPKNGRENLKLVCNIPTRTGEIPLLPKILRSGNFSLEQPESRVPLAFQTDFPETF